MYTTQTWLQPNEMVSAQLKVPIKMVTAIQK